MATLNRIFIAILLILAWLFSKGQDPSFIPVNEPAEITAKIQSSNISINSLQCEFTQVKELSFLEDQVISSGKFYFQRENKIRWEYEKPYSYIIIMNGSMIKIEDEGKTNTLNTSSSRLFSSINKIMAGIIDGSVLQQQEQFNSSFFENEGTIRVYLDPIISGMTEFIHMIELDMNKTDYTVDAMKIIENNGDYTLIRFNNKKHNASISEEIFSIH